MKIEKILSDISILQTIDVPNLNPDYRESLTPNAVVVGNMICHELINFFSI